MIWVESIGEKILHMCKDCTKYPRGVTVVYHYTRPRLVGGMVICPECARRVDEGDCDRVYEHP